MCFVLKQNISQPINSDISKTIHLEYNFQVGITHDSRTITASKSIALKSGATYAVIAYSSNPNRINSGIVTLNNKQISTITSGKVVSGIADEDGTLTVTYTSARQGSEERNAGGVVIAYTD